MVRRRRVIDQEQKNLWRVAGATSAVGIEIFLSLVIGVGGGMWLDRHFHLSPWLTLLGAFAGVGSAIKALVRVARTYNKLLRQDQPDDRETAPRTSHHEPSPPNRD